MRSRLISEMATSDAFSELIYLQEVHLLKYGPISLNHNSPLKDNRESIKYNIVFLNNVGGCHVVAKECLVGMLLCLFNNIFE